jgi:hypothetical protein
MDKKGRPRREVNLLTNIKEFCATERSNEFIAECLNAPSIVQQ